MKKVLTFDGGISELQLDDVVPTRSESLMTSLQEIRNPFSRLEELKIQMKYARRCRHRSSFLPANWSTT